MQPPQGGTPRSSAGPTYMQAEDLTDVSNVEQLLSRLGLSPLQEAFAHRGIVELAELSR